jgi:uncharacterized protein YuzE
MAGKGRTEGPYSALHKNTIFSVGKTRGRAAIQAGSRFRRLEGRPARDYFYPMKLKNKLKFFPDEDILHFSLSDEEESASIELSPNITAELNKKGEIIGIEILNASSYIRDRILGSAEAKLLEKQSVKKKSVHQRSKHKSAV